MFGLTIFRTLSTDIFQSSRFISANLTSATTYFAQLSSATKVKGQVINSPFFASSTHNAKRCKAAVPLEQAIANFLPIALAKASSNFFTSGPVVR